MNTELSTSVMAMTGPVISSMALIGRLARRQALCHPALDVLHHDDRVIDDDADRQHQAEQRQVVEREARAAAMTANVPISDTGTSIIGMSVARQSCRNTSTTMKTRMKASKSVLKTS